MGVISISFREEILGLFTPQGDLYILENCFLPHSLTVNSGNNLIVISSKIREKLCLKMHSTFQKLSTASTARVSSQSDNFYAQSFLFTQPACVRHPRCRSLQLVTYCKGGTLAQGVTVYGFIMFPDALPLNEI